MPDIEDKDLLQVSDLLRSSPSWTIFTHQKIDGDALGAASALYEAGVRAGKRVSWVGPDLTLPVPYLFLPHTEDYISCEASYAFSDPKELYVFLDSANEERGVKGLASKVNGVRVLNIDHHEDNSLYGNLNCVDPTSSSTSELLFRILRLGGWPLSKKIAEALYVGMWTDTGGFAYSNTTSRTHRLAAELLDLGVDPARIDGEINQTRTLNGLALWGKILSRIKLLGNADQFALAWVHLKDFEELGASDADTDGLASYLLTIKGVRFSVFLTEQDDEKVKASFRSKEGIFPASDIARALGGGGHPRASGATLKAPLSQALEEMPKILIKRYEQWAASDR